MTRIFNQGPKILSEGSTAWEALQQCLIHTVSYLCDYRIISSDFWLSNQHKQYENMQGFPLKKIKVKWDIEGIKTKYWLGQVLGPL